MISETLAGTNAGMSEVSLSDTSSSNLKSPERGHCRGPGRSARRGWLCLGAISAAADGRPRQGWWKRRSGGTAPRALRLTQVGGKGVPDSAKTTTPDVVERLPGDKRKPAASRGGGGVADSVKTKIKLLWILRARPPVLPRRRMASKASGCQPDILKAVADSGYTTPTPIQAQGIPHVLQRRDVIGIAQTGTGKTASFTLPMIEMLSRGRAKARMPRALVLEPTRELADQVAESFDKYGKYSQAHPWRC